MGILLNCNGNNNRESDCLDFHGSENDGAAIGSDLCHALAVKGAPCTLPFVASNAEVTAADDGRELAGLASAFNLLGVAGVETELAEGTVLLNEADGDDAGASFVDELADEGGFVHGWWRGIAAWSQYKKRGLGAPFVTFFNNRGLTD